MNGFSFSEFATDIVKKISTHIGVSNTFSNSLLSSLIFTISIIILIYIFLYDAMSQKTLNYKLKIGFYIFISNFMLLFVYTTVLTHNKKNKVIGGVDFNSRNSDLSLNRKKIPFNDPFNDSLIQNYKRSSYSSNKMSHIDPHLKKILDM